jgi:CRP-like cAMP-binding protein
MTPGDGLRPGFLANLDPSLTELIRQRAVVHHYPSGGMIVEANGRWTGIMLSGMARVFLRTPGGRQVTLRYARQGGSIGIASLLGEDTVSAQAVTACVVMELDPAQVTELARTHASLAVAIARELSTRLLETYREILVREQGDVRQRLARQLLHLAGEVDPERPLVVPMSHEEIADAVGSAREVVSRHLSRFQAERMLALDRGRITVVDPAGLHDAATDLDR